MKSNKLIESRVVSLQERSETEFAHPSPYVVEEESRVADADHLRDFLSSVRRRLWLIALITLLGTAAVALYMARQPDLYEAEAQVQVDLETVNTAVAANKNGGLSVNPVNDPAYFNTQLQVLTRPRLLRRVVKELNLEHDPAFRLQQADAPASWWRGVLKPKSAGAESAVNVQDVREDLGGDDEAARAATSREDLAEAARLAPYVEAVSQGLRVEPVKETRLPIKETRLINITYSHTDPRVAARVVNAVADTFVLQNLERKNEANNTTGDILQQRISELQTQVRTQESQLLDYAKSHQILSLDASQNTVVERLTGLNRQLLEAENERKMAEAAYNAALAPGAAGALAEGTVKEAAEAETKLAELRQRRAQLLVETTEEWPEVKEVDNQIAVLEKQLAETRGRAASNVVTNLGTRYRQALAREQALRASFDRQRAETVTQNEAAINYRILQQEIETNKKLLDGMLQRNKENEAVFAGTRNNIHVNDHAIAPRFPVGPRRALNTAVAFALLLGFGVGLAVLLGQMDDTVRTSEDVRRALRLPALAAIPSIKGAARKGLAQPSNSLLKRNGNGNGNGHGRAELLLDPEAPAPLTEVYRQLRTSMLLSGGAAGPPKSLLVTSSVPGEGKTTVAVNTAVSLSRTGALVVIIDADLRRPRLHEIFGLENESGLSTILSGEVEGVEVLKTVAHHQKSRLDVLTAGPAVADSAELLGSEQMRRLVATLRGVYDYVVIDSPPLAYFTDGVLVSSLVDGVVLVVNSGRSTRETVRHSHQLLQVAGAHVCGVALNNVRGFEYDYKDYYQTA